MIPVGPSNADPFTDEWWVSQLSQRLRERNEGGDWHRARFNQMSVDGRERPGLNLLWDYLRGEPPLPKHCENWGANTYPFLRLSRMNYAEIAVGAVTDRMTPLGWRTAVEQDPDGDQQAARIAEANDFETSLTDLATFMCTFGEAYLMVGPLDDDGLPRITVEDPREAIVARDQVTGRPIMAFKEIQDEWTGGRRQFLYGPGWIRETVWDPSTQRYSHLGDRKALPRHDGKIPLVPFANKHGVGDYERHLDALDRINDGIFTRVSIAKYQAYRQRAFINLPAFDEVTGEEIEYDAGAFESSPGTAWRLPEDTQVWESTYTDLSPVRLAIKDDVEGFFAVTRTPLHYVSPEAAQGSAEGASAQREAYSYRVEDRRRRVAAGLSRALALAFSVMGDTERADPLAIQTIWTPLERYSLAARSMAASQLDGILPRDSIFTDILQYAPIDLPRLHAEADEDMLMNPQADKLLTAMNGQAGSSASTGSSQGFQGAPGESGAPAAPAAPAGGTAAPGIAAQAARGVANG